MKQRKKPLKQYFALAVIVIALSAWVMALALKDSATVKLSSGQTYGMALGSSVRNWTPQQLDANFKKISELGVTSVRYDIAWSALQPSNRHDYNWKVYDRIMDVATKYGLSSVIVLDYTPQWARQKQCVNSEMCPPADNTQFAMYATAVMERYGTKNVIAYEIWNEENGDTFWKPYPDSKAYTELLVTTASAMRTKDPDVHILLGGMTPAGDPKEAIAPRDFLSDVYKYGGKNSFDAVAYHPYTTPFAVDQAEAYNWLLMNDLSPSLRSIMKENGDEAKKIWITEYGTPTGGLGNEAVSEVHTIDYSYVSQSYQATIAKKAITAARNQPWIASFYWYTFLDGPKGSIDKESHFGAIDSSGKPKPVYYQIQSEMKASEHK